MQRQWGLFFGAVGLYAATIVAMFVAGPDPYPIYGYGTQATGWAPRDVQVFREASLTVAALVGGVLMLSLPPSWTMSGGSRTRTKAYWAAHPEAFPPIRERNVREYVTVIAFASAVRNLLMLALPGVGVVQGPALGVWIGLVIVMLVRCIVRLRAPKDFQVPNDPTTGASGAAPSGDSESGIRSGS